MNVAVFGLGYVGCVTAACLASQGHHVIGVDVSADKVQMLNAGKSPIVEPGLETLIQTVLNRGFLHATCDAQEAIWRSEVCLICVGTPSDLCGGVNTEYVERVCVQIAHALARRGAYVALALRSTVLPGTLQEKLLPILSRESGLQPGRDFGVVINPEFLREGSAIQDFGCPPFTVIGQMDQHAGDVVAALYERLPAPIIRTEPDIASMVKYTSNTFHALKVVYANEIGRLCKKLHVDSTAVMDIFCQDTHLNISPRYLKPGFAFGGSCLPKDLRSLVYLARHSDVSVPVLDALMPSNALQVQAALEAVYQTGKKRVTLAGLSFKLDTDDLRESPMVILAETLLGKGYEVLIYDPSIELQRLIGGNRAYIEQSIPHIAALLAPSLEDAVKNAEVIIAAHGLTDELCERIHADQIVIDLQRRTAEPKLEDGVIYDGLCW